jgi:hypothetical protein
LAWFWTAEVFENDAKFRNEFLEFFGIPLGRNFSGQFLHALYVFVQQRKRPAPARRLKGRRQFNMQDK